MTKLSTFYQFNEALGIINNIEELADTIISGLGRKKYFNLKTTIRGKEVDIDIYIDKDLPDLGSVVVEDFKSLKFTMKLRNKTKDIIIHELKHIDHKVSTGKYLKHAYMTHINDYITGQYKHLMLDETTAYLLEQSIYLSNPDEFESHFHQYHHILKKRLDKVTDKMERRRVIDKFLETQEIYILYKSFYKTKFNLRNFFKNNKNTNLFLKDFYRLLKEYKTNKYRMEGIGYFDILRSKVSDMLSFFSFDEELDKSINEFNNLVNSGIRKNYKKFGRLYTLLV